MPELPEVETIRRQLSTSLPFKINQYYISSGAIKNILATKMPSLEGKIIHKIGRHGKQLLWKLTNGDCFRSGLGMTGTWLLRSCRTTLERENQCKEIHVHVHLWDQRQHLSLSYDDPRRFGKIYYASQSNLFNELKKLGPDLLSEELQLDNLMALSQRFPNQSLKVILLDQRFFAGSGNYIANEICAHAKLLPTTKLKELHHQDWKNIAAASKLVIQNAVSKGGVTFQGGYRDSTGERGQGEGQLLVFYQKICRQCQVTPVIKMTLGQRGTYYCPFCQK